MGNTTSSDLQQATNEVEQEMQQQQQQAGASTGVRLYKFLKAAPSAGSSASAAATGSWQLVSKAARPRFYNINEDRRGKEPEWHLEVEAGDIDARADCGLNHLADISQLRITFAAGGCLWALRFPTAESYRAFMAELEDDVFETTFGFARDSNKAANELQGFGKTLFSGGGAGEPPAAMEDNNLPDMPAPGEFKLAAAGGGHNSRAAAGASGSSSSSSNRIDGMIIGANSNSYLRRGATFDVMRNVQAGVESTGISFSLGPLKPSASAGFASNSLLTPSKVLLANGETRMNMLSPGHNNTQLFSANIETGQVVSQWQFNKDGVNIPQADIASDCKDAQLTNVHTLLGLDLNRLCRWDMRTKAGVAQEITRTGDDDDDESGCPVVQWTGGKEYSTGSRPNFTCMATSGEGHVVVGSRDGRVRLYSSNTLTQAKTSIPGLGRPITAVDVTYDGRWVLATTDDYLMVVKTSFKGNGGPETNGFADCGGGKLAMPRLLRLKPEDTLLAGSQPFKSGRFQWVMESTGLERWLVASCGKYAVVWNFRRVKSTMSSNTSFGGLPTLTDDYTMSLAAAADGSDEVVAAGFMHDRHAPASGAPAVVVATPRSVFTLAGEDD